MDDYVIEKFADLFTGRQDAYGTDTGGAAWEPVTVEHYGRHLTGVEPFGIYPIRHVDGESLVRWGCCDIDTGDWSEAFMLASALQGMGLYPHVERSRSKGWHIWVFVNSWIPARIMRRCLKVAYAAIDLPAKEANPKSESLRPEQLGNYVRLPYKAAAVVRSERQVVVTDWNVLNDGAPLDLHAFLFEMTQPLFSPISQVERWASKWYEPPRKHIDLQTDADTASIAMSLPATWQTVWRDGNVRDRSATFVAMAYDLAKRGWTPQQVFNVLWSCPWNKYRDRRQGEYYVQDIVERAFS